MRYTITSTIGVGSAPTAVAVDSRHQISYVVEHDANAVSLVNGRNLVATLDVGEQPVAVAALENTLPPIAYVVNAGSADVSEIRGDGVLASTIPVGANPTAIAVDSASDIAYVISDDRTVTIFGTVARTIVRLPAQPTAIAVNSVTHTAYVAMSNATVAAISGGAIVLRYAVDPSPSAIAVDGTNDIVYVASRSAGTVVVLHGTAPAVSIPVAADPMAIAMDEVSHQAYVLSSASSRITVLEGEVVDGTMALGASPTAIAVDGGEHVAYVANADHTMSVTQAGAGGVIATVAAVEGPVAVDQTSHMAYASRPAAGSVVVLGGQSSPLVVDRIDGADRYAVAVAISAQSHPAGADTVFIATGTNYPDALSAGPLAVAMNAPVLLTPPDHLGAVVANEIRRLDPSTIYIVGGPNSVSAETESEIGDAAHRAVIHRIGGADRYEVSRKIAEYFAPAPGAAYVATGANYPDALSAGGPGGHSGVPIVLVDGSAPEIDAASSTLLWSDLSVRNITIVGGPNSVSPGIESSLAGLPYTTVSRVGGADRYEASMNINLAAYQWSDRIFLATGANFPDALAGSAWAGALGAPLIVVPGDCVPQPVLDSLRTFNVGHVTLLGGINSLGSGVENLVPCS
jgi:putative cell wall-binding protein